MNKKIKRNLFAELKQGIHEIASSKTGKITLRTYIYPPKPRLKIDATHIRQIRQNLKMSQSVFALKFRVSLRTLEKWEQGQTIPNDQAAALLIMVQKYPDTLQRLDEI
jgi:putative transcriptional regulator